MTDSAMVAPAAAPSLERQLDEIIDRAIARGRIVGCVLLVQRQGQPLYARAAGAADREAGRPMRPTTVFRLASVTKPYVAATALAMEAAGALRLTDPVTRYLPQFTPALADGRQPGITLAHLLTHTAGLTYGFRHPAGHGYHLAEVSDGLDAPGLGIAENLARIAAQPLAFVPGSAWGYSVALDVLGAALAVAGGEPLAALVARHVTTPLGLADTGFSPPHEMRLARAYADAPRQPGKPRGPAEPMQALHLVEHGEGLIRMAPERGRDPASFASGGAGMYGTAPEFLRFLEAIRTGGAPVLGPAAQRGFVTDQIPGLAPAGKGPGWGFSFGAAVLRDPVLAASPQGQGTLSWGGVYGHSWFMDPTRDLSVVLLTNTAVAGMDGPFPTAIRDAICARL